LFKQKKYNEIYSLLNFQDVNEDIIISRSTIVSNLLQDILQINSNALESCTAVITETINKYPILSSSEQSASYALDSISSILVLNVISNI
jgi:hypothetical protein